MDAATVPTRRPWLAAILSVLGGPLGQVYAGRLRRSLVLWAIGVVVFPACALCVALFLPVGRAGLAALLLGFLAFSLFVIVDAFLIAKRDRSEPLKFYQRWWVYLIAFTMFIVADNVAIHSLRFFLADAFLVPIRSMSPTIMPGDRVLADKLCTDPTCLKRGDIVVYYSGGPDSILSIHRLVGLGGDTIEIKNEKVFVNGHAWDDSHAVLDPELVPAFPELTDLGRIQIPADSFFVLGDNRRHSKDSRFLGPIPYSRLYAKARVIYWSSEWRFPDPGSTGKYDIVRIAWERIGTRFD